MKNFTFPLIIVGTMSILLGKIYAVPLNGNHIVNFLADYEDLIDGNVSLNDFNHFFSTYTKEISSVSFKKLCVNIIFLHFVKNNSAERILLRQKIKKLFLSLYFKTYILIK